MFPYGGRRPLVIGHRINSLAGTHQVHSVRSGSHRGQDRKSPHIGHGSLFGRVGSHGPVDGSLSDPAGPLLSNSAGIPSGNRKGMAQLRSQVRAEGRPR